MGVIRFDKDGFEKREGWYGYNALTPRAKAARSEWLRCMRSRKIQVSALRVGEAFIHEGIEWQMFGEGKPTGLGMCQVFPVLSSPADEYGVQVSHQLPMLLDDVVSRPMRVLTPRHWAEESLSDAAREQLDEAERQAERELDKVELIRAADAERERHEFRGQVRQHFSSAAATLLLNAEDVLDAMTAMRATPMPAPGPGMAEPAGDEPAGDEQALVIELRSDGSIMARSVPSHMTGMLIHRARKQQGTRDALRAGGTPVEQALALVNAMADQRTEAAYGRIFNVPVSTLDISGWRVDQQMAAQVMKMASAMGYGATVSIDAPAAAPAPLCEVALVDLSADVHAAFGRLLDYVHGKVQA